MRGDFKMLQPVNKQTNYLNYLIMRSMLISLFSIINLLYILFLLFSGVNNSSDIRSGAKLRSTPRGANKPRASGDSVKLAILRENLQPVGCTTSIH